MYLNDEEEEGAKEQMMGENINISLICALMFTTFIPLYYTEPARMEIPTDGLTLQIYNGFINSWQEIKLTTNDIHDWFDSFYIIATAGACFGTMVSVFYMLACNECLKDPKVMVLRHYLGRASVAPFYFFAIGIVSWAIGGFLQLALSPQTIWGFVFKFAVVGILIFMVLCVCLPRMVRGVYAANAEENLHPAIELSKEEIDVQVDQFLLSTGIDLSMRNCLSSIHSPGKPRITSKNYRIPLHICTELMVKKSYVDKMAVKTCMSTEEVKLFLSIDK